MVPSTTGPATVRKLEELGAEVEVSGQVPLQRPPKTGVWAAGNQMGLRLLCDAGDVHGKPHPRMSPSCITCPWHCGGVTPGTPTSAQCPLWASGVPQPCSDKGPISGAQGLDAAPLRPRCPPLLQVWDEANKRALELAQTEGWVSIHPFDHPLVW